MHLEREIGGMEAVICIQRCFAQERELRESERRRRNGERFRRGKPTVPVVSSVRRAGEIAPVISNLQSIYRKLRIRRVFRVDGNFVSRVPREEPKTV